MNEKNDFSEAREFSQEKLSLLSSILNAAGIVCFIGPLIFGRRSSIWSILCMSTIVLVLCIYLIFPKYFSIVPRRKFRRRRDRKKVKDLTSALLLPCIVLSIRTLIYDFYFPNWTVILTSGIVVGFLVAIIMYIRSDELQKHRFEMCAAAIIAVFTACSIVCQINHIANPNPVPVARTVIETSKVYGGKGGDLHVCTIELDNETEIELPISRSAFNKLQSGDIVMVYNGKGALGIEYAYLDE